MLKDYFDSTLSFSSQQRINKVLDFIPSQCVFTSYGQARAFRSMNYPKLENGRYDYSIFLFDGFYYTVPVEQFHDFKNFLHQVKLEDRMDKSVEAFNRLHDSIHVK